MDSSGKHNTGFTSFVKEVYKHPLDYYFGTDGDYYKNYQLFLVFPVGISMKKSRIYWTLF